MKTTIENQSRRFVMKGSAAALAAAGTGVTFSQTAAAAKPLPACVASKDASALIVHSSSTLETKRSAFGTRVITPSEPLSIRNNLPAPAASILENREDWKVMIEGEKIHANIRASTASNI